MLLRLLVNKLSMMLTWLPNLVHPIRQMPSQRTLKFLRSCRRRPKPSMIELNWELLSTRPSLMKQQLLKRRLMILWPTLKLLKLKTSKIWRLLPRRSRLPSENARVEDTRRPKLPLLLSSKRAKTTKPHTTSWRMNTLSRANKEVVELPVPDVNTQNLKRMEPKSQDQPVTRISAVVLLTDSRRTEPSSPLSHAKMLRTLPPTPTGHHFQKVPLSHQEVRPGDSHALVVPNNSLLPHPPLSPPSTWWTEILDFNLNLYIWYLIETQ